MAFETHYYDKWVHVKFTGRVDAYDVILQNQQDDFLDALAEKTGVVFDYSQATHIALSKDDIRGFSTLGNVQANLLGALRVVILTQEAGTRDAQSYKEGVRAADWHVLVTTSMDEALDFIQNKNVGSE